MTMARSTFYYKAKSHSGETQKEEADLQGRIEEICLEWSSYGYRRVTAQLQDEKWHVNHKKVSRIMREKSLQCRVKRKWIKTTDSNHRFWIWRNWLKRKKRIRRLNEVWVADITYIRLLTEFVYLAVVMDLYSRKIIGWAISRNIDEALTRAALKMAFEERKPSPGCIHHSDRGVQYAANGYIQDLKGARMKISMSRKGNPYDNAAMESFMKTLKYEEVYLWDYRTMEDVLERVPFFLEDVYNRKRLHSSLGYQSPDKFEMLHQNKLRSAGLPKNGFASVQP